MPDEYEIKIKLLLPNRSRFHEKCILKIDTLSQKSCVRFSWTYAHKAKQSDVRQTPLIIKSSPKFQLIFTEMSKDPNELFAMYCSTKKRNVKVHS